MSASGMSISHLSAWYGQARAVHDVSIDVRQGEIVGLLGRNGAGKTTLLRSITGLHHERTGTVKFGDTDASHLSAAQIARLGVSFVREGGAMPMSMTVEENLVIGQMLAKYRGRAPLTVDEILDRIPLLVPLRKRQAGVLSGGQRQSLALAIAFISQPSILLLDEPSGGLSPQTAAGIFDLIGTLVTEAALTVLVVEQNAVWMERLSARSFVLEVGVLSADAWRRTRPTRSRPRDPPAAGGPIPVPPANHPAGMPVRHDAATQVSPHPIPARGTGAHHHQKELHTVKNTTTGTRRSLAARGGVLITAGLLLAACGSGADTSKGSASSGSSEPFVIGAVNALSGPYASVGTNLAAGAKVAVDAVNAKGGINGRQVKLVSVDDAGDPAKTQLAVKDLVENQKVDFLLPDALSSLRQVTLPYETANKVFAIAGSTTAELGDASKYPYGFLNGELSPKRATAMAEAVKQADAGTKLGMLYSNTAAQVSEAQAMPGEAQKAGQTVVDSVQIATGATDVTAELAKLKSEGAQVVLSAAQYNNHIQAVMSGMETLGWNAPVYFFPEAVTGDVHTQIPSSVSSQFHALMEAPVINTGHQSKELTDFLEAANAIGPVSYLFAMSLAYDAVWIAKWVYETAQDRSGNTSGDSVKKAAESIGDSNFDFPQLAFPPNPGWDSKTHTTANYDYSKFYGVITDGPIKNGQYEGKLLSAS
jgi:branched-chain amino acid transport system ATP-binding protein